jgi:hypothetical protein
MRDLFIPEIVEFLLWMFTVIWFGLWVAAREDKK